MVKFVELWREEQQPRRALVGWRLGFSDALRVWQAGELYHLAVSEDRQSHTADKGVGFFSVHHRSCDPVSGRRTIHSLDCHQDFCRCYQPIKAIQ